MGRVYSGGSPDQQDPILGDPCCTSSSDVTWLLADEDRASQVEVEVACRGKDQPRLGFAALAIPLRGVGRQRMVRAGVDRVEDDPVFAERGEEQGMDDHDVGLGSLLATN